ncbi:Os03g0367501 [Oryza sativa Japonica Group]|uniref:Os03g0367501 protein n=2 Tax=Oryza TaxID=4527 RepID=A0A0P0VYQ2_ORYSJ|nr:Os03g0367501 [Oryza sativa Japonica Group]
MAREEFRLMETPEQWAAACRPTSSAARVVRRIHCTSPDIAASCAPSPTSSWRPAPPTRSGVWVLEDYSDPRSSWRLRWKIDYSCGAAGVLGGPDGA